MGKWSCLIACLLLTGCNNWPYSRAMGANVIRTVSDETIDALAAMRDIEQELARWRQHIERVQASPDAAGVVYQAEHSGKIVEALVADALKFTRALRQDTSVS